MKRGVLLIPHCVKRYQVDKLKTTCQNNVLTEEPITRSFDLKVNVEKVNQKSRDIIFRFKTSHLLGGLPFVSHERICIRRTGAMRTLENSNQKVPSF